MESNLSEKKQRSLSQAARDAAAELQRQVREILQKDVNREPKLTDEEKAEIAQLFERLEYLRPIQTRLSGQIAEAENREKYLNRNMTSLIIAGENAEKLISEAALIKPLIATLIQVIREVAIEVSTSERRIIKIKENAREREAQNEQ